MSSSDSRYIPIAERVQQDVWHDNFVPKYSALATARPSLLVLSGVWLIFGAGTVVYLLVSLGILASLRSGLEATSVVTLIFGLGTIALFSVILWKQTMRYLRYVEPNDEDEDESAS